MKNISFFCQRFFCRTHPLQKASGRQHLRKRWLFSSFRSSDLTSGPVKRASDRKRRTLICANLHFPSVPGIRFGTLVRLEKCGCMRQGRPDEVAAHSTQERLEARAELAGQSVRLKMSESNWNVRLISRLRAWHWIRISSGASDMMAKLWANVTCCTSVLSPSNCWSAPPQIFSATGHSAPRKIFWSHETVVEKR